MLDVIHHIPQKLEEVLPRKSTKEKSLHKVPTAIIDHLQVGDALLRNLEAIKINIRSPSTSEVCRIKVIDLRQAKLGKEGSGLTRQIRNGGKTTTNLKLRGWSHLVRSQT